MRDESNSKIYICDLHYNTSDPDLYDSFEKFGHIDSVSIVKDRDTGESRGFAFIQFESEDAADKAIAASSTDKGVKKRPTMHS